MAPFRRAVRHRPAPPPQHRQQSRRLAEESRRNAELEYLRFMSYLR
jgi:hypothetical protein